MISIKTREEIGIMREGGKKLAEVMEKLKKRVAPGVSTKELDELGEAEIRKAGCNPAFKGYQNFPGAVCTSLNDEVVHVIPSGERILKDGDILTLDIGLIWKGYYADMARTLPVGEVASEALHLVHATKKALRLGIKKAKPGSTTGDIGNTIERFIESQGYSVVRELCGHGIGRLLHEDPNILNYGKRHEGEVLKEGMVICIEPMVTVGGAALKRSSDGYGYATKDGSLAAHFEDTIAITARGPVVLTA